MPLILLKKLLPYLFILIAIGLISYQVYHAGYNDCKEEWDKSVLAIKEANDLDIINKNKEIKSLNDTIEQLSVEASKTNKETDLKSETIIKKVYVYAKENPDTDKSIDVEWLRTYNDSLPK